MRTKTKDYTSIKTGNKKTAQYLNTYIYEEIFIFNCSYINNSGMWQ